MASSSQLRSQQSTRGLDPRWGQSYLQGPVGEGHPLLCRDQDDHQDHQEEISTSSSSSSSSSSSKAAPPTTGTKRTRKQGVTYLTTMRHAALPSSFSLSSSSLDISKDHQLEMLVALGETCSEAAVEAVVVVLDDVTDEATPPSNANVKAKSKKLFGKPEELTPHALATATLKQSVTSAALAFFRVGTEKEAAQRRFWDAFSKGSNASSSSK